MEESKIIVKKSGCADSRSCDWSKVSKDELIKATNDHKTDVKNALDFIIQKITLAITDHDYDKITDINRFHNNFSCGFERKDWLEDHYKINRHHLSANAPEDVDLIDVLEWICDCVVAGMGRSGNVYPFEIKEKLLEKAFNNTVDLIKDNIIIEDN